VPSRLRIAFLGTAQFAVPTLRAVAQSRHQIVAVVTRPDRPAGRGRRPRPSPVKLAAQGLGLAVLQPERTGEDPGLGLLRDLSPDMLFVAAFGEILSEEALSVPPMGAANLHASLLPKHRGAAPIQRAILAGDEETGVTVQWMALALDAGDILLQHALPIGPGEGYGSLHDRLAELGAQASAEAVDLVSRGAAPRLPQPAEGVSYALPVRREELTIDWRQEAEHVARVVRAFSPSPGARTTRKGRLLKVLLARHQAARATESAGEDAGTPGAIVELTKEGFWVKAGKGQVLALTVQPEARGVMSAADYVKGYRLSVGERLGC
jgi:methionyl-tRNA formyltransferase